MIDIYVRANLHEKAEAVVSDPTQLDPFRLCILIKMGKADRAEQATDIVKRILYSEHGKPTVEVFTTLIDAWSKSSQPVFADKAVGVFRLMEENPKCIKLSLRPNVAVFGSFLKCLAMSKSKDAGEMAEMILDAKCGGLYSCPQSVLPSQRYRQGFNDTRPYREIRYSSRCHNVFRGTRTVV